MKTALIVSGLLLLPFVDLVAQRAEADVLCQTKTGPNKGQVTVRPTKCKKGERTITSTTLFTGSVGSKGLACWDLNGNGAGDPDEDINGDGLFDANDCSGNFRIFGDGSGGALTVAANIDWRMTPPTGNNTQFTDFTINSGVTLVVPSGTIIRCTGSFTNNGVIVVATGAGGGDMDIDATLAQSLIPAYREPHPGISSCGPAHGESTLAGNATAPTGGLGGCGTNSAFVSSLILKPGLFGGGGGAASVDGTQETSGGSGGGSLVVLARKTLTNASEIHADAGNGGPGSGGGGGGVVVLASFSTIVNSAAAAVVTVRGGAGGSSTVSVGPGGGGGGGIIHLLALVINSANANALVTAGIAGAISGNITSTRNFGGAGGGGSGGAGGFGGSGAVAPAAPGAAAAGGPGFLVQSLVDPTTLF